jgi:hypothetical protein
MNIQRSVRADWSAKNESRYNQQIPGKMVAGSLNSYRKACTSRHSLCKQGDAEAGRFPKNCFGTPVAPIYRDNGE